MSVSQNHLLDFELYSALPVRISPCLFKTTTAVLPTKILAPLHCQEVVEDKAIALQDLAAEVQEFNQVTAEVLTMSVVVDHGRFQLQAITLEWDMVELVMAILDLAWDLEVALVDPAMAEVALEVLALVDLTALEASQMLQSMKVSWHPSIWRSTQLFRKSGQKRKNKSKP